MIEIAGKEGSFSWKVARRMMAAGFAPDVISSDVHALCIEGPAYDQVTTLSKFLHLGMSLPDVIAASTVHAARALQRPELGTLRPGAVGDVSVLRIEEGEHRLEDVVGEVVTARQRIRAEGAVIGGKWWHRR